MIPDIQLQVGYSMQMEIGQFDITSATSENTGIATVEIAGFVMTVTGIAKGSTNLTLDDGSKVSVAVV